MRKKFLAVILTALVAGSVSVPAMAFDPENLGHWAEMTTAILRGTCSKVEYELRNDESASACGKRLAISALRLAHDCLLQYNHPWQHDYYGENYDLLCIDSVFCLLRTGELVKTVSNGDGVAVETQASEQQSSVTTEEVVLSKEQELQRNFEFIRGTFLPEIERICGIIIASSHGVDRSLMTVRYAAFSILQIARHAQCYLDQPSQSLPRTLYEILILYVGVSVLWNMVSQHSSFNRWLDYQAPVPGPAPALAPAPALPIHVRIDGDALTAGAMVPDQRECSICHDGWYENRERPNVAVAPCNHAFHEECLRQWVSSRDCYGQINNSCPNCRGVCSAADIHVQQLPLRPAAPAPVAAPVVPLAPVPQAPAAPAPVAPQAQVAVPGPVAVPAPVVPVQAPVAAPAAAPVLPPPPALEPDSEDPGY